jgi:hypothetical protein
MAIKPFAIQGADLTLGGVNLQAGTTGVVIPGVTQATNYLAEEVNDTNIDQSVQFVQLSIVIDAVTYNALSTSASIEAYASYTVEVDDDFYIDNIEVSSPGSYTQQEKTTNETTDMWAYTGLVDPFTTPFDEADWLQVPFRPKMRAGEIENVGGGGSGINKVYSYGGLYKIVAVIPGENVVFIAGDQTGTLNNCEYINVSVAPPQVAFATLDISYNNITDQTAITFDGDLTVQSWFATQDTQVAAINLTNNLTGLFVSGGYSEDGTFAINATDRIYSPNNPSSFIVNDDFTVTFPDGTVQTTAYTGYARRSFLLHEYADPAGFTIPSTITIDGMDYAGGEVQQDNVFGTSSSRVTLYADSMFAIIALNTDINAVYYNGEFGSDGDGQKSVSSGLENYRDGYYSWYNKLSGDDPAVTQIVIAKNPTNPGGVNYYNRSTDTNNDDFTVTGLDGATTVIVFNVYWDAVNGPGYESSIEIATKAIIDGAIYDDSPTELTDLAAIKAAFYARSTDRKNAIEGWEGDLLFANGFDFFGDTYQAVKPTGGSGTGAVLELQVYPDGSDFVYDEQDVILPGSGYQIGDTLTVPGSEFGGTSPANDVTITVDTVSFPSGGIVDYTVNGTAPSQVWPQSYIRDGDNDQYDIGNFIGTDRTRVTAVGTLTYTPEGGSESGNDVFQVLNIISADKAIRPGQWAWFENAGRGAFINWALSYGDNNEASYLDEYTGYTSTAALNYDYQVDVDNAHLNINGAGDWFIGSENFNTSIQGIDEIAPEPRDIEVRADGKTWLFGRDGSIYLPQNGDIKDSYGNSVLGIGNSGIPLPDWLNVVAGTEHLPTLNVDYGWDKDGVWTRNFTITGNDEGISYPFRTTDSALANQTTIVTVEFDVSADFQTDFGIGVFAASTTNPVWGWDLTEGNPTANRIGAQYNGPVPELHGISSGATADVPNPSNWSIPSAGTYVARLTVQPTEPGIATITLETLDTDGNVLNTITYTEESFFTTPYKIGFASDNDGGIVKGYFRNLSVDIDGGTFHQDALVNYTSVPTTNADIIGDSGVSTNGSKVTIYTDVYGYQGGEETRVRVKDPASEILNTYYDDEGPFGTGTITFRNGEVRIITNAYNDGQQDGVDMTVIDWSGSVPGGSDNPRFPVTFKTANYVEEVRDSVRIKPSEGAAQYQDQYMKVYAGGGVAPAIDSLHIHMAGAQENVELFLGTDNNYVSAKEAGTTPAGVRLHSDNDVEVVNSNLRINRKGSNWVHIYGDGDNRNIHGQTYDVSWSTMAADEHGDLYVGGEANSYAEAIVSKIGRDGNLIWSKYNNGDNVEGWQLDGIAYHDGQVATLVQTNSGRGQNYYKLSVMDSNNGDVISTTDIYDDEGDLNASSMIYHSTLGWTIVGQTYGEFGTTTSMADTNNPKDYTDWIRLPGDSTIIDGQYPSNYNNWAITGTGITGTQQLNGGVGFYRNCQVLNVTGSGENATVNVVADYNSNIYYIDQITSGGINYATGDTLKVSGAVFGGVPGATAQVATPTAIALNGSNLVEMTFTKAGYPNLYNQLKWAGWTAEYNTNIYNVVNIVSSGSNWIVAIDSTDTNSGTPPEVTFYTVSGNDFLFTCGSDGGLVSTSGPTGTVSKAYIDINLTQLGYNGQDLRASVTKTSGTDFTPGDYRIYGDGVTSYFVLADDSIDPTGVKTWFRNADTITVTEPTYGTSEVNLVSQYVPVPGTSYSGWTLSANIGGGDPFDSNITSVVYKGAPGTFTVTRQRNARAWVWTSEWTRYLGVVIDANDAYPNSRGRCIAEDPNDQSLVVGGYMNSPNGTGNALVWKLSKTGTTLWAKTIDDDGNYVRGIAVSPLTSEIYVASNATAITKIASGGGSIAGRVYPTGMWGVSEPEVHVKVEDDGYEYVYVGARGNAIWTNSQDVFCLNKLTSDLQTVWGRWLGYSNDSFSTDYDIDHTKFVIANGQASIAGYGYIYSDNNTNGLIYTLSTQDQFDSYYNSNWSVQQNADQVWALDTSSYTLFDLLANGVTATTATTQTQLDSGQLAWNNYAFQSQLVNLNKEQRGIKGVETIEFADGGILDHNPSDIPPSQFFDPTTTNWEYTLQLSDRGRFILNQTVPNDTYCQNLYVYVPRNDDVPFPVGTVITLINASSSSAGGQRIYVYPVDYNNQECAKIWSTSGNQNSSQWSFQGIQTATLMKISTNAWLLTANDISNED